MTDALDRFRLVPRAPYAPDEPVAPPIQVGAAPPPSNVPWKQRRIGLQKRSTDCPWIDLDGTIRSWVPGQPIPTLVLDPKTGQPIVNDMKRFVRSFTLVTDPASITLSGGQVSDPIPMVVSGQGPFEVFYADFVSGQPEGFTVEILDADSRAILTNREVHVATIASGQGVTLPISGNFPATTSAGRPFRWPTTFWINPSEGGMIVVRFRNLSASSNTIRFALHGRRWYYLEAPDTISEKMAEIYRNRPRIIPFFYTTDDYVSLTALQADQDFSVRFSDDSWCEWVKGMTFSTGHYTAIVSEKTSGKRYMESAVRDDLLFGTGEFPFLMWEESLFEPNFRLNFRLTDLSGETNVIWLTLACRKIMFDPREDELIRPGSAAGRI